MRLLGAKATTAELSSLLPCPVGCAFAHVLRYRVGAFSAKAPNLKLAPHPVCALRRWEFNETTDASSLDFSGR